MDAFYRIPKWTLQMLSKGGEAAALRVQEGRYNRYDRRNPGHLLDRTGIPAAAFRYGSPEYEALTPAQQAIVDRYLPGTPEYDELNNGDKARVNERNRVGDEANLAKQALIDRIPFPYLRRVIRDRVGPYYRPFDPYRKYEPTRGVTSVPEMAREAERWVEKIVDNTQTQYDRIEDPAAPLPRIQQWYIGRPVPGPAGPGGPGPMIPGTLANPHNADTVYKAEFNTQANMSRLVWQWRINMVKIDDITKLCIKYLRRHMRYILGKGKKEGTPYLDAFNAWWGRFQSIMGATNEPHTGRGAMLSAFWS